jgi:hypothetical protein
MKFRAHDTFFIRKGWLYKGTKNVVNDPNVFMGANGNPMDILGIGANMVKALRYWLQAVGLTSEPTTGRRKQTLTPFGEVVFECDKYIEEMGTLWLLHYKLASNINEATAWYFFFNEFKLSEFTRDDFVVQLNNYIRMNDNEVSERSLDDDYTCIINTYVPRIKSNPEKVQPESNIDCPLGELGLIDIISKKDRLYKKCTPKKDTLHPLILLAVILDNSAAETEIKITSIQNEKNNAGKVFNLDIITLINLLNKLELMGYIKVIRTAGLDVIRIDKKMDFLECVREYYRAINE